MTESKKIRAGFKNKLDDYNSQKDWSGDSTLGISNCYCCICKEEFSGYKRRVICKKCANELTNSSDKSTLL